MGITQGKQASAESRFDRLITSLSSISDSTAACAVAGRSKNPKKSADRRYEKLAGILFRNAHLQAAAMAKEKTLTIPQLLAAIQVTAASLAGQFKDEHDAPTTDILIARTFGGAGGGDTLGMIHAVAERLAAQYGQGISRSTVRQLLPRAGVRLIKAKNDFTAVNIAQHYAAWEIKLARSMHQLYSGDTLCLGIDAMRIIRMNDDSFNKGLSILSFAPAACSHGFVLCRAWNVSSDGQGVRSP